SCKAKLFNELSNFIIVVAFVQTEVLSLLLRWLGLRYRNTGQCILGQFHIIAVGAVDGQADWYAIGLDQQTALGSAFGSIGRVFACLFPPQGAPWSCTRPHGESVSVHFSGAR